MDLDLKNERSQIHQSEARRTTYTKSNNFTEQHGHDSEKDHIYSTLSSPEDTSSNLRILHGYPSHKDTQLDKTNEQIKEESNNNNGFDEALKSHIQKESCCNRKKRKDNVYESAVHSHSFLNTVQDGEEQKRLNIEKTEMLPSLQNSLNCYNSQEVNGCRPKQNITTKRKELGCKKPLEEQNKNEMKFGKLSSKGRGKVAVARELTQNPSQLKISIKRASRDVDYLTDFLEVLAEAFILKSTPKQTISFFETLKESNFFETVEVYLVGITVRIHIQTIEVKFVERVLRNILCIISEQITKNPSCLFIFRKLLALIGNVIEELSKISSVDEDVLSKFQYLSELRKNQQARQKQHCSRKYDYEILDGDFRQLSVSPTADEITNRTGPLIRPNKVDGSYKDLDEYLDVHFRLLREDFVGPLRDGMTEYIHMMTYKKGNQNTKKKSKNQDIRVYENVRVYAPVLTPHGLCYKLRIRMTPSLRRIQWKFSKRLIYGSMVCLIGMDFQCFFLATVVEREDRNIKHGFFTVHFEGDNVNNEDVLHKTFTMTETTGYFESYKYVLSGLQSFKEGDVPFEKYIVKCQKKTDPPAYLTHGKTFDFSPLVYKEAEEQSSRDNVSEKPKELYCEHVSDKSNATYKVCVMDLKSWPSKELLHMDKSQYDALQNALTTEFAIIQGPPGTGKTYIGLQIVKVLLHNKSSWTGFGQRKRPMLVVCYTNHALDQFLEGIVNFCNTNVLRVGGRSNSVKLEEFNLKAYRKKKEEKGTKLARLKYAMRQARRKMESRSTTVQRLALTIQVYQSELVREDTLLPEMGIRLYHNLITGYSGEVEEQDFSYIVKWLEIEKIEKECTALIQNEIYKKRKKRIEVDNETDRMKQDRMIDTCDDFVFHSNEHIILKSIREDIAFYIPKIKANRQKTTDYQRKLSKKLKTTLVETISNDDIMSQEEADKIDNVWELDYDSKWRLYRRWIQKLCTDLYRRIEVNREEFENASKQYCEALEQVEKEIMEHATIIGMTTSGAARYQSILRNIAPSIIVVEEAAEVLEAHIITTLSKGCKHLILIGDHKQLRPNPTVYNLAVKYNLDVSLFERMVQNGIKYSCLELQHRMRPEISSIMKHIYPELKDHEHVKSYPCVKGVSTNLFCINHSYLEDNDEDKKSYSNKWEAEYAVALCRHLLLQGYKSNEITVLTTYTGQLMYMKDLMPMDEFSGVKVTVVDNYQGEENEIIILSLVRSNKIDKIGFLKTENRICVALSRAKIGFFILGNFDHLAKHSDMWKEIVEEMINKRFIGKELALYCQNHPHDKGIKAKEPKDFGKAPDGGCRKKCNIRLNCGHSCERYCHVLDQIHETDKSRCEKSCTKTCELGHKCQLKCYMECLPCPIPVIKTLPKCGHSHLVPCGEKPEDYSNQCSVLINFTWSCGHTAKISCWQREFKRCPQPCWTNLKCGHICGGTCGTCYMGRIHQPCQVPVTKVLDCGHIYKGNCRTPPECTEICTMSCDHLNCTRPCREPCVPCKSLCSWRCPHYKCTKRCSEICNRPRCNRPCKKSLRCKHKCIGLCGEPCPSLCRKCDRKRFYHVVFDWTRTPNSRYVLIENCGHLIESLTMDKYMVETEKKNKLNLRFCPVCKTVIRKCRRYGNILKQIFIDIERIKMEAIADMILRRDLKYQVLKFSSFDKEYLEIERDIDNGVIGNIEALSEYPCHYLKWNCKKKFEERVKDVYRRLWTKRECSSVHEQISFALEIIDLRQWIHDNDSKPTVLKSEVEQDYVSFLYELLLNVSKPRYILTGQEIEDFRGEILRGRAYIKLLKKRSEMQSSKECIDEAVIFNRIQQLLTERDTCSTTKEIYRRDEHFHDLTNKTGKSQARLMKSKGVSFACAGRCTCDQQLFDAEDRSFRCSVDEIEFGFCSLLENNSKIAEIGSEKKDKRSTEAIRSEESSLSSGNELSYGETNKDGLFENIVCASEEINADDFDQSTAKKSAPTVIEKGSDCVNFTGHITFGDFTRPVGTEFACIQTEDDV